MVVQLAISPSHEGRGIVASGLLMERFPVAPLASEVDSDVDSIVASTAAIRTSTTMIVDWLRREFGIDRPSRALAEPHKLDADGFVSAARAALPKSRKWSAAEIARLKEEYADTLPRPATPQPTSTPSNASSPISLTPPTALRPRRWR